LQEFSGSAKIRKPRQSCKLHCMTREKDLC
jgi:hypothetical protein